MTNERLLTWKGRRLRSHGDSPETAAQKVPSAPRPGSLFFVPSPLEGWGLDVLLARLPPDCAVVFFEKDAELAARCQPEWESFMGARRHDARLFALQNDTEQAVRALFTQLPLAQLRRCELLPLSGSWMLHRARYREIFARLESGLTRWWSNRITEMHLGPLWVRNLFDNVLSLRRNPWPDWGQAPVVVCGAGVTLESALPWVSSNREKLKLLVADTALPALRSWNLVPDAVVCLESQHANLADFAAWLGTDVPLFADLTAFPPSTRIFSSPPHWFISEFSAISLWNRWPWSEREIPRLPPLGSVGVAAAWLAWRLSTGPVVLAGLDFSYPPGQSHARGSPPLQTLAARTSRYLGMEQIGGWEQAGVHRTSRGWLTTAVMEGYAGVLADQAQDFRDRTWTWSDEGLPLGLDVWDSTSNRLAGESGSALRSAVLDPVLNPRRWLKEERQRWRRALELLATLNQAPTKEAWEHLESELHAVDYLTFAFPDPAFRKATDWLSRVQAQLRWALDRTATSEE